MLGRKITTCRHHDVHKVRKTTHGRVQHCHFESDQGREYYTFSLTVNLRDIDYAGEITTCLLHHDVHKSSGLVET